MSQVVNYHVIDNVGVISVNNPPVNALSQSVRKGILNAVTAAQNDQSEAILILCEGKTFIAGADITEFGKPPLKPILPEVLAVLENSKKLIAAAIHGTALGGGFETALACHYRCAVVTAKLGLPEVKLGLLPGAGGTQRVARVSGVKAALDIISSGNPISASQASELGLVDEIISTENFRDNAISYVKDLIDSGAPLKRIRDINIDPSSIDPGFFNNYRKQLARKARGQIAPDRIVTAVESAVTLPMDKGLERERELFLELVNSPESAAMRHMFFAEREAAKIADVPKETPTRPISSVAIIGSGTMGGGIAMCFANAGIPVKLLEINQETLQRGMGIIRKNYNISVQKRKLDPDKMQACLELIEGTINYDDLADVDLVIEAVFEDPALKKEVFAVLDRVCKPGAILASNTSYQDIDEIAAATGRSADVLGMHFFSPANIMKLLEVVRGKSTSHEVLATVMKLGKRIGKVCVLAKVCYGFIGNRMLSGYSRQAQLLLTEGCTPEQVDSALEKFGMAMGVIAMSDLAGLDVGYKARQARRDGPAKSAAYHIADLLVEQGRLGQKTGAGFYKYDSHTRARTSDPEVEVLIRSEAQKLGISQKEFTDEEILQRCFYALVNEGARILEEGIAQRPGDIDVVYVYGYAFPAARGGPMFWADQIGLKAIYKKVCEFRDRYGDSHWQPAPLLEKLAAEDRTFSEWAAQRA